MMESFGIPENDIAQWAGLTSAIFSLSQAVTALPWVAASDRFGRKPTILIGLFNTMCFMLMFGFSTSLPMAITARALQGVFGALIAPAALSLLTVTFTDAKERARAFAVFGAVAGSGGAIGLILGGALTEIDWRWNFFINLPIGVLVAFFAQRILTESEDGRGSLDIPGAITSIAGLSSLVYGLTHAASTSWSDPTTVTYLAVGALLLIAFVVIETVA